MPVVVELPRLSDTMEEGVVAKWLVKEGDKVKRGQVIAEIETDKATMEFESFDAGTVLKLVAGEGETLALGAPIAVLGKAGEDPSAALAAAAPTPAAARAAAASTRERPAAAPTPTTPTPTPTVAAAPAPVVSAEERRILVPGGGRSRGGYRPSSGAGVGSSRTRRQVRRGAADRRWRRGGHDGQRARG